MPALQVKIEPILPPANVIAGKGGAILRELENSIKGAINNKLGDEFEKRVTGWKVKPTFVSGFKSTPDQMILTIGPDNNKAAKVWRWVSGGTKRHFIVAGKQRPRLNSKGAKSLYIRGGVGGYFPKTELGDIYGGPGTYASGSFRTSIVDHPGIDAREFERHIAEDNTVDIIDELEKAIDRGIK